MKTTSEFIWKLLNMGENVLAYSAIIATFVIMCLTTADVLGRYVFNRPIIGAYEITENYLMVSTVFLAVCYAYRGGSYIRVTFFLDRLPRQLRVAVN